MYRSFPQPPDDRVAARILLWLSISVGVTMVGMGIIWPIMPLYAVQLRAADIELGLIIARRGGSIPECLVSSLSQYLVFPPVSH